jgi:hypothetical protein
MEDKEIQDRVDVVMSGLPKSLIKLKAEGKYLMPYIQHVPEQVEMVQSEFLKICADVLKDNHYIDGKIHRQGIIGRFLDDSGSKVLYSTWYRFMCIDENYREWCQPYYAINHVSYKIEECCCINDKYPELVVYFRDKKIDIVLK